MNTESALNILKQYWGHSSFRSPQEEVVQAVLENKDSLALMPTGGGKSICFQVPTMMREGLCLVITPLIALMQDQVRQLDELGIKAVAIHSGMSGRLVDITLDNCVYGKVKFLYVSPERLQSDLFKTRLKKMDVRLLVVDEAHCISQWGYDFRPAYLKIAEIRPLVAHVPLLALTATATPEVQKDILEKLQLKEPQTFKVSFRRPNIKYQVLATEDKGGSLVQLLKETHGSVLVYVSTRKKTRELARDLHHQGFSSTFYHAGLSQSERQSMQNTWLRGGSRIMVATNAFGMGINKPNVRLVVHYNAPDHLEGYYQESGRAGRDGEVARAVVLYQSGDIDRIKERKLQEYPTLDYIATVYQQLANHYQLAVGAQQLQAFDFDLDQFAQGRSEKPLQIYHALKKLQLLGLIELTESFYQPAQLQFLVDHQELYRFQIAQAAYEPLIKTLLRLYGGELITRSLTISEGRVAQVSNTTSDSVKRLLNNLQEMGVVAYFPRKEQPQITFLGARQPAEHLHLDAKGYNLRRELDQKKLVWVQRYMQAEQGCRTLFLMKYFGELSEERCQQCDLCLLDEANIPTQKPEQAIITRLTMSPMTLEALVDQLGPDQKVQWAQIIQSMLEKGSLMYDDLGRITLPITSV